MKRKQIVLLMCSSGTDTKPTVSSLSSCDVEILVPSSREEALENLDAKAVDLAIVESKLDDSSGLTFLSEARRRSPGTLRVVPETEPIQIPLHALVNEIAPAAIFDGSVDPRGIVKLLSAPGS